MGKIRFKDLSGWLMAAAIGGWIMAGAMVYAILAELLYLS